MSLLDDYDPHAKWHMFAFRADRDRLDEFRRALEQWISWRDLAGLRAFRDAHLAEWYRERAAARVPPDRDALGKLVELAPRVGLVAETVAANVAKLGPTISRVIAEEIAAIPARIEHLERLERMNAPEPVQQMSRELLLASFELREPEPDLEYRPPIDDDFRELFETCIELVVRDPWAGNVGYGPFLEYIDPPQPAGAMLVDTSWPVHFENADGGPPCVYGFDGFDITILDGEDRDELAAFQPDEQLVANLATDLVSDELEAAGEDLDGEPLDDDDDPYFDPRRRVTLERAPDRVAFEVRRVRADWDRAKARFLSALDDVRAGRCALLCWSAKNPAF